MQVNRRRSALATLAGSSSVTLVAAIQSVVLLPLYLSVLGAHTYGAWLATGEAVVWMLAFDLGIPNFLTQRSGAFLAVGKYREIGAHAASSVLVLSVLAVAVFAAGWFVAPAVSTLLSADLTTALRISALSVSLAMVSNVAVGLSRGLQDTGLVQAFALTGVVAGFVVTLVSLQSGLGVESIAFGLLARSSVALIGAAMFWVLRVDRRITSVARPDRESLADMGRHCPGLFVAGMSYALMNNSMVTVAALAFRPEVAAIVGVTRKAADLARAVLDMVGHATYGGFAHLFAEGDSTKSNRVHREIVSTYFVASVGLLSAYVAVNQALVTAWVGAEMFGGVALTVAMAIAAGAGGWSYLQASLLRSIGAHGSSSAALIAECTVRLALMVGLAFVLGPVGLPLATIATSLVTGVWCARRLRRQIGGSVAPDAKVWTVRFAPFVAGALLASVGVSGGWTFVLAVGSLMVFVATLLLVVSDPALAGLRNRILRGAL